MFLTEFIKYQFRGYFYVKNLNYDLLFANMFAKHFRKCVFIFKDVTLNIPFIDVSERTTSGQNILPVKTYFIAFS